MYTNKWKAWSHEDENYLMENWGEISLKMMSLHLKRPESAIEKKGYTLGLGSLYTSSQFITAKQASEILGVDKATIYNWIDKYNFPCRRRKFKNAYRWITTLPNILRWLEENQKKWDSRKIEEFSLGIEPDWLKEKRKQDILNCNVYKRTWSDEEKDKLIRLKKQGLTYSEIAKIMNRTRSAVSSAMHELKNQGKIKLKTSIIWTDKEVSTMLDMELQGYTDKEIAWELGREKYDIMYKRSQLREKGLYKGTKKDRIIREMTKSNYQTA